MSEQEKNNSKGKNKGLFTFIRIAFLVMIVLVLVYFGIKASRIGYDYGYRVFTESAIDKAPGKDVTVLVEDKMSEMKLAENLEEKGLVRDSHLFYVQLRLSVYHNKLIPGVYTLNTSMEPKEMMAVMATPVEEPTEEEEE